MTYGLDGWAVESEVNHFLRLEEGLKVVDEGRDGGSGFAIER